MTRHSQSVPVTRRDVLRLLGAGTGLGLITASSPATELLAAALQSRSRRVTFPKGAIIRTIVKDVSPDALGNGATLFHEHLSISDPLPP